MSNQPKKQVPRALKQRPRRQQTDIRGRKFNPGVNPPDVTLQPFNQIVMVHIGQSDNGTYEYKATDVIKELISQIDPEKKLSIPVENIDFRIMRVRAWNLTGKTLNFVSYDFLSKSTGNYPCLKTVLDVGSPNTYPCTGYEWPIAHQQSTLTALNDKVLFTLVSGSRNQVVIYVNLIWKLTGLPKPRTTGELLLHIASDLNSTLKVQNSVDKKMSTTNKQLNSMNSNLRKIRDAQPGLVKKIVDGVLHIGAYVAPLAADEETISRLDELKKAVDLLSLYTSKESLVFLEPEVEGISEEET